MNDSLNLSQISSLLGDKLKLTVRVLLNIIVRDVTAFFNVGKAMTGTQLTSTVDLIVQTYLHFKPEDFKNCFTKAKRGEYGQLYDRIDGGVIMSWLLDYEHERDGAVEVARIDQANAFKKMAASPLLPSINDDQDDINQKHINQLRETLAAAKIGREKEKEQKPVERVINPVTQLYQQWLTQFTDLSMKQARWKGIRMVYKYGRWLDANAYLEYKQWQYQEYLNRKS